MGIETPSKNVVEKLDEQERYAEMQERLQEQFDAFVERVPPIESGFSADPKDILRSTNSLGKEQLTQEEKEQYRQRRREALADFKDTLSRQRESFMQCRLSITNSIRFTDGAVSREVLLQIVDRFAESYSYTDVQRNVFERAVDSFVVHRQRTAAFRERFSNDIDLMNELLSQESESSDSFDVTAQFAISIESGVLTVEVMDTENFKKLTLHDSVDGVQCDYDTGDGLLYYIVLNMSSIGDQSKDRGLIYDHELEHVKYALLSNVFYECFGEDLYDTYFGNLFIKEVVVSQYRELQLDDPDFAVDVLKYKLRQECLAAFDKVKEEVFAILQASSLLFLRDNHSSIFLAQDDGSYDYLAEKRLYFREEMKDDLVFQEVVEKYFVQYYQETITEAVQSFFLLVEETNFTEFGAMALLTDVPLQDWKKVIGRMMEQERISG